MLALTLSSMFLLVAPQAPTKAGNSQDSQLQQAVAQGQPNKARKLEHVMCDYCKEKGHYATTCPKKAADRAKKAGKG